MTIIASDPDDYNLSSTSFSLGIRLSELHPSPFQRYMDAFVTYFARNGQVGYHVKRSYQSGKDGFIQAKSKKGKTLALFNAPKYQALTEAVERHLDTHLWSEFNAKRHDKQRRHDVDQFYWLGLHAPKWISHENIDFDNSYLGGKKRIIGFYRQGRDERQPVLPVVHLPLEHFQRLKAVYDAFPNRIWCISSETLGLNAWAFYTKTFPIDQVRSAVLQKLTDISIKAEVHPMPGRCQRRPFGRHYRTITNTGVLTDWTDQMAHFNQPPATPPFQRIVHELLKAMLRQWANWLAHGEALDGPMPQRVLAQYHHEVDEVKEWMDKGMPVAPLRSATGGQADYSLPVLHLSGSSSTKPTSGLSKDWVHLCQNLATNGLSNKKSLFETAKHLTSWLYWVELYHVPPEQRRRRVIDIFMRYVAAKHNGHCSRLLANNPKRIERQVAKRLDWSIKHGDEQSYKNMRWKRANGKYKNVIELVPVMAGLINTPHSLVAPTLSVSSLELGEPKSNDDKMGILLPISVQEAIKEAAGRSKVMEFASRFLRYLYEQGGECPVSQERLTEFLGYTNPNQINKYKAILVRAGVLKQGDYKAHVKSRRYTLLVKAAFDLQHGLEVSKSG